jgi:hypothetical protein
MFTMARAQMDKYDRGEQVLMNSEMGLEVFKADYIFWCINEFFLVTTKGNFCSSADECFQC